MDLGEAGGVAASEQDAEGQVQLAGQLQKKKEGKNWKARHCSLVGQTIALCNVRPLIATFVQVTGAGGTRFVYRKKETDKKPMGVLPLVGAWITTGEKPTAFASARV
jgi:hypothetical protein